MHYAVLNSSGNALGWFEDQEEAQRALDALIAASPDADLDVVAFAEPGRLAEPVSPSMRSAGPVARPV